MEAARFLLTVYCKVCWLSPCSNTRRWLFLKIWTAVRRQPGSHWSSAGRL